MAFLQSPFFIVCRMPDRAGFTELFRPDAPSDKADAADTLVKVFLTAQYIYFNPEKVEVYIFS